MTYRFLEVGDEVVTVLLLLQAGKRHLCTRNVLWIVTRQNLEYMGNNDVTHLFGVLEVFEKSLFVPVDALVDVGSSVREAFSLT